MSARVTDEQALDIIAGFMGGGDDWNGGDICEMVADLIGQTGRPHPGAANGTEYVERFDKYLGCSGNNSARYFDMTTAAQDAGWEPEEEFGDGQ